MGGRHGGGVGATTSRAEVLRNKEAAAAGGAAAAGAAGAAGERFVMMEEEDDCGVTDDDALAQIRAVMGSIRDPNDTRKPLEKMCVNVGGVAAAKPTPNLPGLLRPGEARIPLGKRAVAAVEENAAAAPDAKKTPSTAAKKTPTRARVVRGRLRRGRRAGDGREVEIRRRRESGGRVAFRRRVERARETRRAPRAHHVDDLDESERVEVRVRAPLRPPTEAVVRGRRAQGDARRRGEAVVQVRRRSVLRPRGDSEQAVPESPVREVRERGLGPDAHELVRVEKRREEGRWNVKHREQG